MRKALMTLLVAGAAATACTPGGGAAPSPAAATSAHGAAGTTTGATTAPATTSPAGGGTAAHAAAPPITVEVVDTPSLGVVLADPHGMTLYRRAGESGGTILCTGTCLKTWRPLARGPGEALHLPQGFAGTLGSVTRPDGTTQVTFDGAPLYTFTGDRQPGDTNGYDGVTWTVFRNPQR